MSARIVLLLLSVVVAANGLNCDCVTLKTGKTVGSSLMTENYYGEVSAKKRSFDLKLKKPDFVPGVPDYVGLEISACGNSDIGVWIHKPYLSVMLVGYDPKALVLLKITAYLAYPYPGSDLEILPDGVLN